MNNNNQVDPTPTTITYCTDANYAVRVAVKVGLPRIPGFSLKLILTKKWHYDIRFS
jgi:hypothetical protein